MSEREIKCYSKEQWKQQYENPQVEWNTSSKALRERDTNKTIQNMAEEENRHARAERKFDTMLDKMSCLLAKMDQQATQNQNKAEHSGFNEERSIHCTEDTRGSASRPLFPTFTPREEQPHVAPTVSFGDEAR